MKQRCDILDVDFRCGDYEEICEGITGAVIYCDIPYRNTTKYHTGFDYDRFYRWATKMSEHNVVLISEYSMPRGFVELSSVEHMTHLDSGRNGAEARIEKLFTPMPTDESDL